MRRRGAPVATVASMLFLAVAALHTVSPASPPTAAPPANLHGSFAGYFTLEELRDYLRSVAHRLGPELSTQPTSIGRSGEGRDILRICIGQCAKGSGQAPAALYTGLHHAREPMGMMALVYTLEHIVLQYLAGDQSTAALLESRQLWFIPALNPDGYEKNRAMRPNGGGNQRKNSNGRSKGACKSRGYDSVGVDLNRNYALCWSGDCPTGHDAVKHSDCGSSKDSCHEDYRGPSAFSEAESQAVRDFLARLSNGDGGHPAVNFSVALNYHSFAKKVFLPYSCVKMISSEPKEHKTTLARMAHEWADLSGFGVDHVWASDGGGLGYSAAGDATDWMYAAHGIFTLTPEVGPTDEEVVSVIGNSRYGDDFYEYGFWPPAGRIPLIANETTTANIRLSWLAGPCYKASVKDIKEDGNMAVTISIMNVGVASSSSGMPLIVALVVEQARKQADSAYEVLSSSQVDSTKAPTRGESIDVQISDIPPNTFISHGSGPGKDAALLYVAIGGLNSCNLFLLEKIGTKTKMPKVVSQKHVRACHLCANILAGAPSPGSNMADKTNAAEPSASDPAVVVPASSNLANSPAPQTHENSKVPCAPMTSPSYSREDPVNVDWSALWSIVILVIIIGAVVSFIYIVWFGQRGQKYKPLDRVTIELPEGEDFGTDMAIDAI